MRKNKFCTIALTAILAAEMAMSTPVTAHAEGTDEVGDILDDIFGGDKPEYNPDGEHKDDPIYWDGEVTDDSEIDWGPTDSAPSEPESKPEPPAEEPKDDVGNILDDIFGGDKPAYDPNGEYKDSPVYDGGHEVTDDSEINWGPSNPDIGNVDNGNGNSNSVTVPANPGNVVIGNSNGIPVPANPGNGATVTNPIVPGSGSNGSATVASGNTVIPVTDEPLLAAFPGAMFVTTPEGFSFIDAFTADYNEFQVWFGGSLCNAFKIVDAKGNVVKMNTAEFVNADGKSFLNITIPAKTKGAKVFATDEQKSAFTRLCGVDGIMVNGVLLEEFQDTVRN